MDLGEGALEPARQEGELRHGPQGVGVVGDAGCPGLRLVPIGGTFGVGWEQQAERPQKGREQPHGGQGGQLDGRGHGHDACQLLGA